MDNTNVVLTREKIMEKVWNLNYFENTRTVDVHIRRLRKKIGSNHIKTIRGVGYKFVVNSK